MDVSVAGILSTEPLQASSGRPVQPAVRTFVGIALLAAVSLVLAWNPFLASGAVVGGMLVWLTINWPVAIIGITLALGPLDLSFLTGGFKELFPELGGLDMNGIRLVGVSAGLALIILTDRETLRTLRRPRTVVYLVFLAWATLTLAWSPDRLEGLRFLFKLAFPLLVFLILSAPGRTAGELDRIGSWILVGATVFLLLSPAFAAMGSVESDTQGFMRVGGPGIGHNPFSFYLLVIVLICAGRFAVRGELRYLVLGGAAAVWMALTLTRITFAAALLGLLGMSLYGALINRNYRAAAAGLGLGALLAVALAPIVLARTFFGHVPSWTELTQLLGDPVALFYSVNWQGRQLVWPVLTQAWMDSPWIGHGLGASATLLDAGVPGLDMVPHNEYLRVGAEAGWMGVGLFFLAVLMWLRMVLDRGRRGLRTVREHALPALAATLAWAVISATDNAIDYYGPFTQYIGFLMAGTWVGAREAADGAVASADRDAGSTTSLDPAVTAPVA